MAWLWSVNPIVGWSRGSEGVARHTGDGGTGAEIIGLGGIWPGGMCGPKGSLANPLRHTQKTRRKAGFFAYGGEGGIRTLDPVSQIYP